MYCLKRVLKEVKSEEINQKAHERLYFTGNFYQLFY